MVMHELITDGVIGVILKDYSLIGSRARMVGEMGRRTWKGEGVKREKS